jgi:hypothetical protein
LLEAANGLEGDIISDVATVSVRQQAENADDVDLQPFVYVPENNALASTSTDEKKHGMAKL